MLSFRSILVPTDFSDHSLRAIPYAVSLAESYKAKLKVIYVNEPSLQVSDVAWVGVDNRAASDQHLDKARRTLERIILDQVPRERAGRHGRE